MLTVSQLKAQLADLPDDAQVEVSVGHNLAAANAAISYDPSTSVVTIGGPHGRQLADLVERIRQTLYADGPGTEWSPDTLNEIAGHLTVFGLTSEDGKPVTQDEPTLDEALDLLDRAYHDHISHDADCPYRHHGECLCLRSEVAQLLADAGRDP